MSTILVMTHSFADFWVFPLFSYSDGSTPVLEPIEYLVGNPHSPEDVLACPIWPIAPNRTKLLDLAYLLPIHALRRIPVAFYEQKSFQLCRKKSPFFSLT